MNVDEFKDMVKLLTPITVQEANEQLSKEERKWLFVGRATCPYCRKFLPKLINVVRKNKYNVYFLDSEDRSDAELMAFRDKLNIATVPSVVSVGGEPSFKLLPLDSSSSEDEIEQSIEGLL